MIRTTFRKALLLGALGFFYSAGIGYTTDIHNLSGDQLVTSYKQYVDATGGATTGAALSFRSAASISVVEYAATNATTLNAPVFNDGIKLSLKNTAVAMTLNAPTFTQTAAAAYMSLDGAGGVVWGTTASPIFNGNGWIDVTTSAPMTFGVATTITAPIHIATGVTLTIIGNFDITFSGVISGGGTLAYAGTGNIIFGASPTGITYSPSGASTLTLNNGVNFAGAISLGSAITLNAAASATATVSGIISGSFALTNTMASTSTLILSGANTFTGGLTASGGGTISVGHNTALGTGTLVFQTVRGTLTAASSGLVLPNAVTPTLMTINVPTNYTLECSGAFAASNLKNSGAGTLVLSSSTNALTTVDFSGGRVNLKSGGKISTVPATVTVNAATILGFINSSTDTSTFTLNAPLTTDAQVGAIGALNGIISGNYAVVNIGGGEVQLGAANTFSGGLTVNAGILTLNNATAHGTGTVTQAVGAKVNTHASARTITIAGTAAATVTIR